MHMNTGSLFDDPDVSDEHDDEEFDDPGTFEDDQPEPPLEASSGKTNGHHKTSEPQDEPDEPDEPDPEPERATTTPTVARLGDLRLEYKFWKNPRTVSGLDDVKIAELATSIKTRTVGEGEGDDDARVILGVTDPLKVVPILNALGKTDLLIVDGQRRYLACMQVVGGKPGNEVVPVLYLEPDPIAWSQEVADHYYVDALHGVGTREGLSAFELSENAELLRGKTDPSTGKKYTLLATALILNRSESWVSKILTARQAASSKLLQSWRRGEITEEQFRDLAVVKDKEQQETKAKEVASARESGGRGTSRAIAKGEKLIARKEAAAAKPAPAPKASKTAGKPAAAVRGPQAELPVIEKSAPVVPEGKKPKPMAFAVIEDVLDMANKVPPTHDMVRGIMLGLRVASGLMDAGALPKPWQTYLALVAKRVQAKKAKKK